MTDVLEFIVSNYIWILLGAIIILLAIIGSYADKTNFGQGKSIKTLDEEEFDIEKSNIKNMRLGTLLESEQHKLEGDSQSELKNNDLSVASQTAQDQTLGTVNPNNTLNDESTEDNKNEVVDTLIESKSHDEQPSFDEKFEKFDKEFDSIIPKKNLIDDELLEDIDSLSIGKAQDLDIDTIPDLDDLELPKIKQLENEEEDIWKF